MLKIHLFSYCGVVNQNLQLTGIKNKFYPMIIIVYQGYGESLLQFSKEIKIYAAKKPELDPALASQSAQ